MTGEQDDLSIFVDSDIVATNLRTTCTRAQDHAEVEGACLRADASPRSLRSVRGLCAYDAFIYEDTATGEHRVLPARYLFTLGAAAAFELAYPEEAPTRVTVPTEGE